MFSTKRMMLAAALVAFLSAAAIGGCAGNGEGGGGEHGAGSERSGGEGSEGYGGGEGGEGGSAANQLAPDETFDMTRNGARLIMNYDAQSNSFKGTVENTTNTVLTRVRIEVHLSNGTELGPTTPIDIAAGEVVAIDLPSTQASFTGWVAHAEVGSGEGGESGGEGGSEGAGGDGPEGAETGGNEGGGQELNEAAMSSPIIPLARTWKGDLGPLAIDARYDAATKSVISTVRNTTSQNVCYVQAEPHLKNGTTTVGELGPDQLGDLGPGQTATTNVSVASEPALAGVAFDGYVIHMEVFDCAGPGPQPHTGGEGAEGSGGEGSEGAGGDAGGEEGGSALALDETFDTVRNGARLIMSYDTTAQAFIGTVENTTNATLQQVRIEVHLSNGVELGPTTPQDLAAGATMDVRLDAKGQSFTGWTPHAEVGPQTGSGTEGGSESGGEGSEGSGGEGGGEHGSGGEGQGS